MPSCCGRASRANVSACAHSIPRLEHNISASKMCGAIRCFSMPVNRCAPCYLQVAGSNKSVGRLLETVTTLQSCRLSARQVTITLRIAQGRASLPNGSTMCWQKSSVSKCFKAMHSYAKPWTSQPITVQPCPASMQVYLLSSAFTS